MPVNNMGGGGRFGGGPVYMDSITIDLDRVGAGLWAAEAALTAAAGRVDAMDNDYDGDDQDAAGLRRLAEMAKELEELVRRAKQAWVCGDCIADVCGFLEEEGEPA